MSCVSLVQYLSPVVEEMTAFINTVSMCALHADDRVSCTTSKELLHSAFFSSWRRFFTFPQEEINITFLQATLHLSIILNRYGFSSWTMVLFGSVPGFRKLLGVLLATPAYAVPFFLSYYLELLTTGHDEVFGVEGTVASIKSCIVESNTPKLQIVLNLSTNYLLVGVGLKQNISNDSVSALAKALILTKGEGSIQRVQHLKTPYLTKSVTESLELVCYDPSTRESIRLEYSIIQNYLERTREIDGVLGHSTSSSIFGSVCGNINSGEEK
jgi:hypothetical protein